MKFNHKLFPAFLFMFLCASFEFASGQVLTPRASPLSTVSQYVGISKVEITYSRPSVKDRVIWGELVPYDEMWRTGANESSTIEFSHPAKINGADVPAAKYGLFTIPGTDEWTVILSKDNNLNGTSGYKEENDAVRIKVKPVSSEFNERLTFDLENITDNSANVVLKWEKIKVPFNIEFNTPELVMANIEKEVSWGTPLQGATYILQNDMDYNEGLKWANISSSINENYWNLRIKAQLLAKAGKKDEAISTMEKALEYGNKMSSKPFDYAQMEKHLNEWKN
jgi:hypothetical protein